MRDTTYKVQIHRKEVEAIQTLGELLRHARTTQERALEEAALELKISPLYLESLEAGDYASLPCFVYTRNFVKHYGTWLGLNCSPLLQLFEQEWKLFDKVNSTKECDKEPLTVNTTDMWTVPRWLRFVGSFLIIASFIGYLGYEVYELRQPPTLVVNSPVEEMVIDSQLVEISGMSEPEAELMINNQTILADQEGNFDEMIALQPGLNIISISAKHKHSQSSVVHRKIFVTDTPTFSQRDDNDEES